jgi:dipeptidyl aminopeptidase/acylaminoacyl peptidase
MTNENELSYMRIVRVLTLAVLGALSTGTSHGQKPALSDYDLDHWEKVNAERISNDGHYLVYSTSVPSTGSVFSTIRSLVDGYSRDLGLVRGLSFTEDSREFLYLTHDSLVRLDLGTKAVNIITGVRSFETPPKGGLPVLVYQRTDEGLVVLNRATDREWQFEHVEKYIFSDNEKILLVFQRGESAGRSGSHLQWVDLVSGRAMKIWQGTEMLKSTFDLAGRKLAFFTHDNEGGRHCRIWEFDSRKDSIARVVVSESADGVESGYSVGDNELRYSPDGDRLFFDMYRQADSVVASPDAVKVDIWNYRDEYLQCDQLNGVDARQNRQYLSVVNVSSGKVMRLEQAGDGEVGEALNEGDNDKYVLTCTRSNMGEAAFYPKERSDLFLVDTRTGERICIAGKILPWNSGDFSTGGRYVVRYDKESGNLVFYNIVKRQSKTVAIGSFTRDGFYGYGGWLEGDNRVFVYDKYDLWEVDPEGKMTPVNLTNGYGWRHGIYLRLAKLGRQSGMKVPPVKINGARILCAIDGRTKANSFYRLPIGRVADPDRLSTGENVMYVSEAMPEVEISNFLLKARDTDTYVLMKSSAEKSPNVLVTHDFRNFTALTDIAPEKRVNWLTTELVRWRTFDGRPGQGILYRPEDFDSTKKYPVIFYFYEQLSGGLNKYINPDWTGSAMNIPWFVSRDYVVFCPDIEYTMGDPGKGIYNYVVSAAMMMKQKSWVDGSHLGIQGHSFGGYEVNYLVTRTGIFAAASEGAGPSDLVSNSGEAGFAGCAGQNFTERGQFRMKVPFWQNLPGYIANSPVFAVNKVTTPLLMLQCKKDGATAWPQGVEFFTALRRLGRPCYLLQYDEGGHRVGGKDAVDYTRRMTQFFDHYLKGSAAPKWMVEGIPARLKGIDNGLELAGDDAVRGR